MVTTTLLADAPILKPNVSHKNFTETGDYLRAGTEVNGDFKAVNGLRRGKPFDYKIFITDEEEIIYSKYVKPMGTTEVTLNADSQVSATKVEMIPAERKTTMIKIAASAGGAVAGFAFARYKKYDRTKTILLASAGALVGYMIARQMTKSTGIVVQKSK